MIISENQAKTLGLTVKDIQILNVLEVPMRISFLATKVKIPRTSLYSMLMKLKRRGFLKQSRNKIWSALPDEGSALIFKNLFDDTSIRKGEERVGVVTSSRSEFVFYKGVKNLISLYKRILKLHKHSRLYVLQPNQSTEVALKKFPFYELVEINKYIQENQIIVEAVLHDNATTHYFETILKQGGTINMIRDAAESIGGRVADTIYIPQQFLTFKSELYIMSNVALILNWDEEIGIEIKNSDVVGMLKEMFNFIKAYGKKVDQNRIIQEFLNNLK